MATARTAAINTKADPRTKPRALTGFLNFRSKFFIYKQLQI